MPMFLPTWGASSPNWSIVVFVITVSTLYGVSVLFPDMFSFGT